MRLKLFAGPALAAAILLGPAAPALAHVTTDPDAAPKGGEITLRFRVPNELTNANVVKVDVAFPTDRPLLGVAVEPIPGWTSTVTEVKLDPPVQTDDGPVTEAVSEIAWNAASGGGTPAGQFQEFPVLIQGLPSVGDQVVLKTIETYSDGTVVRWIDPVVAGQAEPEHPTPILKLTGADDANSNSSGTSNGATVDASKLAKKSSVSSASTLGVIGIVMGALGLLVAVVAIARRPGGANDAASTP